MILNEVIIMKNITIFWVVFCVLLISLWVDNSIERKKTLEYQTRIQTLEKSNKESYQELIVSLKHVQSQIDTIIKSNNEK